MPEGGDSSPPSPSMGDSMQSRSGHGYTPSGATGTSAVREQLNLVKQELQLLAQELAGPGGKVQGIDLQAMERLVKHLEVDREELTIRSQRLAEEKKELLEMKNSMEAELYDTKRQLDDAMRQLRHQEIDLQRLKGGKGSELEALPQAALAEDDLANESIEALQALQLRNAMPKEARQASKFELLRALRVAQDELSAERARGDKLQNRLRKDRQRLQLLEDAAERQRQEILAIRHKKQQKVAASPEFASKKILQNLSHTSHVHRELPPAAPSPFGNGMDENPLLVHDGDSNGFSRSTSAPQLPKMTKTRGNFVPI